MRKLLISTVFFAATITASAVTAKADTEMYRMYNPNSGEHFYTASHDEAASLQQVGWNYEGIGWIAPESGAEVYRLYNPNAGDHHYTANSYEKEQLIKLGWNYEGIGWRSGGSRPVFRSYNPNAEAGTHNYTASQSEAQSLVNAGWRDEGIAWYAVNPKTQQTGLPADTGKRLDRLNQWRATTRKDVLTAADGAPRAPLTLDADLTSWAQIRAEELAAQSTGFSVNLSHENKKNGMPAWADGSLFRSPNYDHKSIAWGPEALYYEFDVDADTAFDNAVDFWWDEYNTAYANYSHYLILSSPLANRIGFGVARAHNGAIIVAAEIAYR
ncbi:hypothetical protein OfM1_01340 [Lactovum odontotermitis]